MALSVNPDYLPAVEGVENATRKLNGAPDTDDVEGTLGVASSALSLIPSPCCPTRPFLDAQCWPYRVCLRLRVYARVCADQFNCTLRCGGQALEVNFYFKFLLKIHPLFGCWGPRLTYPLQVRAINRSL